MTQEDKQLLLTDLCARLPYGVVYHTNYGANIKLREIDIQHGTINYTDRLEERNIKPYLRPMSSMTGEEKIELCTISYVPDEMKTIEEKLYVIKTNAENAADFYNKHHFDYHGLIEKGLALEAPENMYNK